VAMSMLTMPASIPRLPAGRDRMRLPAAGLSRGHLLLAQSWLRRCLLSFHGENGNRLMVPPNFPKGKYPGSANPV